MVQVEIKGQEMAEDMPTRETRYTVWSYQTTDDETRKPYRRTAFFYAGSVVYDGSWLGPSDCVWFVPATETAG